MQTLIQRISRKYRDGMRRIQARSRGIYSYLDEQILIQQYIKELKIEKRFCVDIAAGDGVLMSNTYFLYREGWEGLAVEYGARNFAKLVKTYRDFQGVNLARCKVTPPNVVSLLNGNELPKNFGVLSLDIDGYDFFVLEQILSEFRPSLICAEVNENIPPPVKFTVKWDPDYAWREDHFFGQSLSQLCSLCPRFRYSLVELHYNNAFLVPSEINPYPSLTPEEAYQKGYVNQPDRKEKFHWNINLEPLLSMRPEEAVAFVNRFFFDRKGEFICSL